MKTLLSLALVLACSSILLGQGRTRRPAPFHVEEKTIAQIHAALRARQVTCRGLLDAYLARIKAYDQKGPSLNAVVLLNPDALQTADELDARMKSGAAMRPLECIPVVVKDNYETKALRTTAGSQSLAKFIPNRDAFVVRKIREAGAIVLFKSNMAEFAFTPLETVSSIQPGYTFNPYALNHTTAGSSGGTAAAVAANFGAVGLGTDTGNSIRGPSSHQSLVGIRSTMGLVSRTGVVPLNFLADIAGPMTRTVEDAAVVLQVIAGPDAADPVTLTSEGHIPPSYLSFLKQGALKGVRLGVLHAAYDRPTADPEVMAVFKNAQRSYTRQTLPDCRSAHRTRCRVAVLNMISSITSRRPVRRSKRSTRSSKAECFIRRFVSDSNARKRMTPPATTARDARPTANIARSLVRRCWLR